MTGIFSKITNYISIVFAGIAALSALLFSRERKKRQTAEAALETEKAINASHTAAAAAQVKINKAVNKAVKKPNKSGVTPDKIFLPIIICLFAVACGRVEYVPVCNAPELFIFDTGAELVRQDDGLYCTDYDGAVSIQSALQGYRDEIEIYNEWRAANEKR